MEHFNDTGKSSFAAVVKKTTLAILLASLPTLLSAAQDAENYLAAEKYFNEKKYEKAFPLLEEAAKEGSKPAMYRLGYMYENGLGVKTNFQKSSYWYKRMSAPYSYIVEQPTEAEEEKRSFFTRVSDQMDPSTNKEGAEFAIRKMDTGTPETRGLLEELLGGNYFGLQPYKANYILPLSYATSKYPRRYTAVAPNADLTEGEKRYEYYDENTEVEFQISLKKQLTYDLFGWNEYIVAAYTQSVWWQLYSDSGPFRETNYMPEVFMTIPTSVSVDEAIGLKAVKTGFIHQSNGQEGYRSRSWNRLFVTGLWQWDNLFLGTRVWYRLSEDSKYDGYFDGDDAPGDDYPDPNDAGDDNPHIQNYLGYGDVTVDYLIGEHQVGSLFRYNFGSGGKNRGAIDAYWSVPFFGSENVYWYTKFFSGYGESLSDYDRSVTKYSFGFAFSRGLY